MIQSKRVAYLAGKCTELYARVKYACEKRDCSEKKCGSCEEQVIQLHAILMNHE
jgi:hypothetical protein